MDGKYFVVLFLVPVLIANDVVNAGPEDEKWDQAADNVLPAHKDTLRFLQRGTEGFRMFAPGDCCSPRVTHPSLKTTGTIYFYMPLDMKSGGPADAHWFHGSLGKLGYNTKMFKVNEEYQDNSLVFSSMTEQNFHDLVLEKNDLLVIGELVMFNDAEYLKKFGGQIVRWLQGVHPDTKFYGYDQGATDASVSSRAGKSHNID